MKKVQLTHVLQLSRWKEYIYFVIPLTLAGGLLAVRNNAAILDYRIIFVLLGNFFAVAYAFMLNDIEDAADDARDPKKAKRNPVSAKKITRKAAFNACRLIAVLTMLMFAFVNWWVIWIGGATLLLSHLYSWKPIRLKAWPVVDIVSHSLMLSCLLILSGYFAYVVDYGIVWFVVAGATMISVYGQLYNQLRDFEVDKKAKLKNTAILLGKEYAVRLMYLSLAIALFCLLYAAVRGAFPYWVILIAVASGVATNNIRTKTDASGTAVFEVTGSMQMQGILALNATVLVWLAVVLIQQVF